MDYSDPSGFYLLDSGVSRECVDVFIQNDALFEFPETFMGQILRVTDQDNNPFTTNDGLTIDIPSTVVTIEDNDGNGMILCVY